MISIVIPLYNKAPHIRRAVDSVLRQSVTNFECIVVDDGSTDGSGDIIKNIKDPRIRLIRQSNMGVSAARNRGVAESACPFVAFLDADDEWLPRFLESVILTLKQYPEIGVVFTNFRLSTSESPWLPNQRGGRLENYFDCFVTCRGHGMSSSSVLIRKDILQKVGGFPIFQTHGEDINTWTRLAWEAPVAYVPEILAIYHISSCARAMDANGIQIAVSLDRCAQLCRDRLKQGLVAPNLRRSTRSYAHMLYTMCAREQKDVGAVGGAFRTIIKSLLSVTTAKDIHITAIALLRTACPSRWLEIRRQLRSVQVP